MTNPLVSVIIVNYKGAADTITCLRSFADIDWPADRIELVVVDNDSGDGSVEQIKAAVPHAKVIASQKNLGFAGGCNLAVSKAKGAYVAFINNDARPDRRFLAAAVGVLERSPDVGAVATKVLDWDGELVDFVTSGMSWYGQGFKLGAGDEATGGLEAEADVLFGTGSSLIMPKKVFQDVGGFDEDYFMFFEDVDLGWRLWLLGYRVRYVPEAISFHKHHASMSAIGEWREKYLLERNALYTIYKNYDEAHLEKFLPGAIALAIRRGIALGGDNPDSLDLAFGNVPGEPSTATVSRVSLASSYAVDAFARSLPDLNAKRAAIQARRRRPDSEIIRLFGAPLRANVGDPAFLTAYDEVVRSFGISESFTGRKKIAVLTQDALAERMAGPAIRAWQIAAALSQEHDVQLATTGPCDLVNPVFQIRHVNPQQVAEVERWADVIIFQGYLMREFPVLQHTKKIVVADIYDPMHLEQLEQARDLGEVARRDTVRSATAVLNEQIMRADYLMCASQKQRDFWLGQMAAVGRVNPVVYDDDPMLTKLIGVVPFGVGNTPPVATRPMVKGVIPGIGPDDKVILWGGGIYNWFDPLTLIRAIEIVKRDVPNVRLLFMGVKHPNPAVPQMRMAVEAQELAGRLGLLGREVIFNHEWVPYEERQNFLLESDIGVSTHLEHIETAFSFRTRILDYLWASLPIVCTDGDSLSELVGAHDLGRVVPPGDEQALAAALTEILTNPELAASLQRNVAAFAPQYRWSTVLKPLLDFCRNPQRAPDLLDPDSAVTLEKNPLKVKVQPWGGLRGDISLVGAYLRQGGPVFVVRRILSRLKRLALRRPREE